MALLTHNAQFPTGNNGLDFPPNLSALEGEFEKYGYYDCMYVGVDTPNGYEVGQVALTDTGAVWSITGATSGFAIDASTGMITLSDNTQLTVAEDRVITVQRVIGPITDSVDIVIHVVDDASDVGFFTPAGDDNNDGRQPHKPRQTLANSNDYNTRRSTMLFLRGAVFEGTLPLRDDTLYASYGNPLAPSPEILFSDVTSTELGVTYISCIESQKKPDDDGYLARSNVTVKDFILNGNNVSRRLSHIQTAHNPAFRRVHLKNNADVAYANGILLNDIQNGCSLRFITAEDNTVYGDAIYGKLLRDPTALYEIGYCEFGLPKGSLSDCIQITDEGNESKTNYNVWIHHTEVRNGAESDSLKGGIVVQGAVCSLVEHCTIDGKYFGMTVSSEGAVMRKNRVRQGGLPTANSNNFNTWGLGFGGNEVSFKTSMYDNYIDGTNPNPDGTPVTWGFFLTGFDLEGLDAEKYDSEMSYNKITNCLNFGRTSRDIAWSGFVKNNLADNNVQDSGGDGNVFEERSETIATQGDYQSKEIEQPYVGFFDSLSQLYVRGATGAYDGGVLTAHFYLASDETLVGYQWRLNGVDIDGANSNTYTIPTGTEAQLNDRMPQVSPLNAAEVSLVVTVQDVDGNRDFVISDYYKVGHENPVLLDPLPEKPIANAGMDKSIEAGASFTLDGSASFTNTGSIVEYRWEQIAGDIVELDKTDPVRPLGVAPRKSISQTLTFSLVTVNNIGLESDADTVTYTVQPDTTPTPDFLLEEVAKQKFLIDGPRVLPAFSGRSNIETFRFKLAYPNEYIALDENDYYDFDKNLTEKVMIVTDSGDISSESGDISWSGSTLLTRLGAFQHKGTQVAVRIVVYLAEDDRGVVIAGPGLQANLTISFN